MVRSLILKLDDAIFVVFQVLKSLSQLIIKTTEESLRLCGLLLQRTQSIIEVVVSCEANLRHLVVRWCFWRSDVPITNTEVGSRGSLSLSIDVRLGNGISLQHFSRLVG